MNGQLKSSATRDATVCESCQRPQSEHGAPHAWDGERRPSCPSPSLTGTYRPAPTPPTPLDVGEREEVKRLIGAVFAAREREKAGWAINDNAAINQAKLDEFRAAEALTEALSVEWLSRLVAEVERMANQLSTAEAVAWEYERQVDALTEERAKHVQSCPSHPDHPTIARCLCEHIRNRHPAPTCVTCGRTEDLHPVMLDEITHRCDAFRAERHAATSTHREDR